MVWVGKVTGRETAPSITPVIGAVSATSEDDTSEGVGVVTEPDFRFPPTVDLKPLKHTSFFVEFYYSTDPDEAYEVQMLASDRDGAVHNIEEWRDVESDLAEVVLQMSFRMMDRIEGGPTLDPDD
jgi:hypothetical protein